MLSKIKLNSLKTLKDFNEANKEAIKFSSNYFLLVFSIRANRLEANNAEFLAGFKISKKVGNAVKRNKIRRRVKAILQSYLNFNDVFFVGKSMIFIPRKQINELDYLNLKKEFDQAITYLKRKISKKINI